MAIPEELIAKFRAVVCDKEEMNKVLHHCLNEFRKIDRFFDWKTTFHNMISVGIIDDDTASKEYANGLSDFYDKLLEEMRMVEESDLDFIGECTGEHDKSLFHDNMIIGICLLNDVTCYDENEKKIVNLMGGCMLRKFKHDHDFEKIQKLGDTSHLFADPIDIKEREDEGKELEKIPQVVH